MKFRVLVLGASALFLSACATNPQQAQTQYVQACGAYASAFATAVQLQASGKLSAAQKATLATVDQQITPICTGPLPTNATQATTQVTAALTTLAVLGAVQATTGATK